MKSSVSPYTFLPPLLAFIVSFFFMPLALAQNNSQLTQAIDAALNSRCLDQSQTSVSILSLPEGRPVYNYHADTPLLPASTMKILTTAAALNYLGPEYRFRTEVLHTGIRYGEVIQGDLVLRGKGDPSLHTEDLMMLARRLKASGISEIRGRLLVDTSFFDQLDRAPSWETDRSQRAYDASIGALSLNYNTVAVRVLPAQSAGQAANAWLEPETDYIQLVNQARTVNKGKNTISARRTDGEAVVQIKVTGQLPIGSGERVIFVNVENPARYAAATFRQLLAEEGVRITGPTEVLSTPLTANLLYEHLSAPLSLLLKELNTYSSNFMAEQILKTIAAFQQGSPATHVTGLKLMAEFLRTSGVNTRSVMLADGSGLSRKNQLTTEAMTDLLNYMYSRFDIGPDFMSSLRVMGAYGAHSKRLSNSPAKANIRAKTGTLNGVSALAGYVASQQGDVFAYALFLNNNRCGYSGADKVEDQIVTAIYNYGTRRSGFTPLAAQQH